MKAMRVAVFAVVIALSATAAAAGPATLLDRYGGWVSVEPYAPNIVRVTISTDKAQATGQPGYGFTAEADDGGWAHSSGPGGEVFASAAMRLELAPAVAPHPPNQMERYFAPTTPPVSLKVERPDGTVVLDMTGWEMSPHTVAGEATFQVGASFTAPPGEHVYGLGQNQEGYLDRRGHTLACRHDYDAPAGETVCMPFMVSSRGYGIVWDNPSATQVAAAVNGRTVWRSQVGERVSFFVILGATSDEIYAGYRRLTGVTPLPPKAAFGLIQSKARYASQTEVLDVADGYRRRGLPLDVMVVDWFYWTRMGQLDIDPAAFPDPAGMNRTLHAEGIHTLISVWPRFERGSRYFDLLASKGWLLKDKDGKVVDGLAVRNDRAGALIDSTNPAARAWYWDHIRDNILSKGFDWVWQDETEPDLVPDGAFFSIGSGDRYHNLYPLLHTQAVADGSRRDRPDLRNLILARAAYLGAQRNGALFWSSDIEPTWEALRRQVPTGLNVAASGLAYWGNDIAGWQGLPQQHTPERPPLVDPSDARDVVGGYDDYPELFVRWFEYGTFTPTLRLHGMRKGTEVWAYGKQAEAVAAKYLKLRYALMPYLYALGRTTYETGAPFMRALFMDFPDDPKVADIGDEYMFGPAFLVAPVTEQGRQSRSVYLPAGADWYDYWTGEKLAGGQTIEAKAPIDVIPLYVRAGSIIPYGSEVPNTATPQRIAAVRVYPGRDASFRLYDDDGISNAYQRGAGRSAQLHWDEQAARLTAAGDPALTAGIEARVQIVGR
jgi:alpha-D-xyloside xylohydrolase